MNLQPTLRGTLVTLEPTVAGDWCALFAAAADPEIWAQHPASDRWKEPVFRAYFDDALASGGSLTIRDRASGEVIGASRYANHDPQRDEIEIGWTFLARRFWGGPVNAEVKRLMLDHILAEVRAAVFVVGAENLRSRRAMEKIGGVVEQGRTQRGDGSRMDRHVFYRIAREHGAAAA